MTVISTAQRARLIRSSQEDAPPGMGFLYDSNMLNVAKSRAWCACIVMVNPRLFEPDGQTPRPMLLANALSRFLELARHPEPTRL